MDGEITNLKIPVITNADEVAKKFDRLASSTSRLASSSRSAAKAFREEAEAAKEADTVKEKSEEQTRKVSNSLFNLSNAAKTTARNLSAFWGAMKNIATFGAKAVGVISYIPRVLGGQFIGKLKESVKGLWQFFDRIKRIALYRAIRSALKFITEGFQEGLKNLYAWSNAADGKFAAAMDRLSTASKYVGNSIAAMASPLIEAVAPAIDFVVDKFVDLFNIVNQFFARLTGQSTYTAAKKVASVWDDSTKKAAGSARRAADEIKRTILGFDEINKLNGTNDRSSGGGSGSSATSANTSDMFEKRNIEGSVSSFADALKAAFNSGEWSNLGKLLGDKVNSIINSVDFGGIGAKVGTYINGWFSTKYWTLDTINFTNIGSKIADFLNNAISKIDFGIIGRTLVQRLTIVGDTLIGFFTDFDFGKAASSISDFVKGIYGEITKWLSKYNWSDLGSTLYQKIKDTVTNFDFKGVASEFVKMLGSAVRAVVQAGAGFLANFWKDVTEYWDKNIKADTFTETVHNILDAIGKGFSNIGAWVYDAIIHPFIAALTGNDEWEKSLVDLGKTLVGYVKKGWDSINLVLKAGVELVKKGWTTLTKWVGDISAKGVKLVKNGWKSLTSWVGDISAKGVKLVKNGWITLTAWVGNIADKGVKLVKNGWTTITAWVGNIADKGVKLVKNGWITLTAWVGNIADKGVKLVKNGWTTITAWVGNIADKGVKLVKNGWITITAWVGNIADKGVKLVKNGWTTITAWVGNIADKGVKLIRNGWTTITSWVGNIGDKGVKLVKNGWTTITAWVGNIADKGVKLVRNGWTTITAWVGNIADKGVKLVRSGWTTITSWVGEIGARSVSLIRSGWTTLADWAKSFGGSVFELFIKPVWDSPLLNYLLGQNAPSDRSKIISEDAGALVYAQQSALKNNIVITADLEQGWFGTPESALGIDNLYTDVDVGLERAWGGDPITVLGLKGLTTEAVVNIKTNLTDQQRTTLSAVTGLPFANGGIIFGNSWTDIPQYAGGTLSAHGSLFLAGEAGPEIVGHVGGRTEVLNKSQIAAAMYSAVQAAMAPATATMAYAAQSMGANSDGIDGEALASMIQQAVENAMSRINDIARQGNEYLRQISDKDFSAEITTSSMNKAQTRMNRRAGVTLVPVGT